MSRDSGQMIETEKRMSRIVIEFNVNRIVVASLQQRPREIRDFTGKLNLGGSAPKNPKIREV